MRICLLRNPWDFPYASLRKFVSVLDFIALMITDGLLKPSRYRRLSWESIRLQRHLDSKPNELQYFSPSHFSLVPLGLPETDLSLMMSNVSIEQNAEEWDRWDSPSWFAIAFCLLGVVPGLFTSAVLTIYFFSTESAFETTLETEDLVEWMTSLDLDLGNVTALETVDPKDMMVRCSLDFGVHAIITIFLHDVFFANKKRAIVGERDEWASAFIKHTNNIYDGDDAILYKEALLDVLVELFESVDAGVMNRESVKTATSMVQKLREAFRTAFSTSSWVTGVVREVAIKKLENMQHYVGSPGQRLDPAKIDNYYDAVPDVDTKRFFKAYRGALQASTHRSWTDQKNWIFDETTVNAYYVRELNTVVIPAGILQHPFFNVDGPAALNYGGAGVTIGHEIMHGYDVGGSMYDEKSMQREWGTPEFMKKYTERTLCLRESHRAAEAKKARQGVLNDTVDSENLADFVGTALAHAAFASLPSAERNLALPGLNLTAEHLFFIGSCAKLCARQNVNSERYAASRFRCNVPLMNMAEFSSAFGCAPESPMNPSKKCAFWS
ncbi:hypothetical protein HPB52_012263 [Rhipicephalus sanguineus]|uniref:Peptidase M13 C-terminal domain-containing protein n=1 Tax=Rhipicephalus sanguineus TaxID=34632 RepID=A0A9D4SX56_RHISA|nr:hypothetical protein HPB52_012263 [Rhipicephalus sanguineus]